MTVNQANQVNAKANTFEYVQGQKGLQAANIQPQ